MVSTPPLPMHANAEALPDSIQPLICYSRESGESGEST
ncbi:MAG: hypothetical protein J07HQW2_00371 [Haloquadratum walsbyi J07HQW2]|uniref:Uncharacterized protein n=1 Tax=Haloquadratum walsbyi J07HQW2 TaxID=1238425 RepID=U1PJV2_9EURY|nr:MAG: hypothetical protein J07HQW2_00371 [Haloquadratum walsbyi J07HQW2]